MLRGYPLVICYIAMDNHHAIHGKIQYFNWAIFNSYVSLPEGRLVDCFLQKAVKEVSRLGMRFSSGADPCFRRCAHLKAATPEPADTAKH